MSSKFGKLAGFHVSDIQRALLCFLSSSLKAQYLYFFILSCLFEGQMLQLGMDDRTELWLTSHSQFPLCQWKKKSTKRSVKANIVILILLYPPSRSLDFTPAIKLQNIKFLHPLPRQNKQWTGSFRIPQQQLSHSDVVFSDSEAEQARKHNAT